MLVLLLLGLLYEEWKEIFVAMGVGEDFGWVWKTAFKTTTCGKVGIQLPCGNEGMSHGEACVWFEGA
jgi:hypothetical protein